MKKKEKREPEYQEEDPPQIHIRRKDQDST
jgi:hypothetical protein